MGDSAVSKPRASIHLVGRWLLRLLMLSSAVLVALIVSGAIFQVIPGIAIAHTTGISMVPTYHTGDVVVLRIKHPSKVRVGDVVLFQEDVAVTHRVIKVGPDEGPNTMITTKGDNNPTADTPIKLSGVEGEIIAKLPLLGDASRWLGAGSGISVYYYGVLLLDLGFILLVAVSGVFKFNRESKHSLG